MSETPIGGYEIFWKHIVMKYSTQVGMEKNYPINLIFYFYVEKNYEALTRLIFVEYLQFSFSWKVSFVDYCQEVLNLIAQRVPQTTLTHTLHHLL